jgi:hypothetical protein
MMNRTCNYGRGLKSVVKTFRHRPANMDILIDIGRTEIGISHNRVISTDVFGGKLSKQITAAHLVEFDSTKNVRNGGEKAEDHPRTKAFSAAERRPVSP